MKKILVFLIIGLTIITLCACGIRVDSNKSNNQEIVNELLEESDDVLMITIMGDFNTNVQSFKEKYCGKTINIQKAIVKEITNDFVYIGVKRNDDFKLEVHLPQEELAELEKGQTVSIVGTASDDIETKNDGYVNGASWKQITIENAYLSQSRFVISGKLEKEIEPNSHGWSFSQKTETGLFQKDSSIVYFSDNTDFDLLKSNNEITIKGIKIDNVYKDAEIVSID